MNKLSTKRAVLLICALFLFSDAIVNAQDNSGAPKLWHNKERVLNYHPDGQDIFIVNGKHRFNRAIYGTNTAFRVETGDLPEFALYLPGMGGNLHFGLGSGSSSKWLIEAKNIEARYRAGSMIYTIHDELLGKGTLTVTVLAGAETESVIIKTELNNVIAPVTLYWAFGGVTGKKFSRDGDLGADPESSFYLKPEYCAGNAIQINNNSFYLNYTGKAISEADRYEIKQPGTATNTVDITDKKVLNGTFPTGSELRVGDATQLNTPLTAFDSKSASSPMVTGKIAVANLKPQYFLIQSPEQKSIVPYAELPRLFAAAEVARQKIANRIVVNTPDPYINTLGGTLSIAADAIWESPSYMHGAIAWRMRLNAWRGPYVADVLGWHDRARSHFDAYAASQTTLPPGRVVADTALHLARSQEKMGNAMFSDGYISRNPNNNKIAHHYDMNLVTIDELLNHFNWTGDLDYVKKMWPVITRSLAWEKRNFDADGDGLYDAYCAIWASDALQYSGGGVTHSSAYNYRANKDAARLAKLIGEDPTPYQKEAEHILTAINKTLWMPQTGQYAEYQDLLGNRLLHPSAALWTVYHAIDEGIADNFQAYQELRYVDTQIPHIPIIAKGVEPGLYTLSTTNWMPYDWSLNNVALAEELHTALAYWQGGRAEEAFKLWKGSLLNSQYLESSPGNFDQLSFYDSTRGELYRDFADPIGMAGRSLVEGLFGIHPDALARTLTIKPGLPGKWDHASLHTPDVQFDFKRISKMTGLPKDQTITESYIIVPAFSKPMNLVFEVTAMAPHVKEVTVNGQKVQWKNVENAIDGPVLQIKADIRPRYEILITYEDFETAGTFDQPGRAIGDKGIIYMTEYSKLVDKYDPQGVEKSNLGNGVHTTFLKLKQGEFIWWAPMTTSIDPDDIVAATNKQLSNKLVFKVGCYQCKVIVNSGINRYNVGVDFKKDSLSRNISVPLSNIIKGSNTVRIEYDNESYQTTITNWNIQKAPQNQETINLTPYFNDQVTNIFKNKYLSPRPQSPTLQLPWQGIGNWCYPLVDANIDDSGLRKAAGDKNEFVTPQGLKFATPGKMGEKNILFTSNWDNYPKQVEVPLSGKASHAYFMMAGSTNPMQSRITNGEVVVNYTDGTSDVLELKNPQTWWPIEQDYEEDGYAFQLNAARPIRVYLKSGIAALEWNNFKGIKGFATRGIDGGAGTILDLPLNPAKELKNLQVKAVANDVVIGLMGVTLVRE
ncbi:DUF4450 domain-containing protein [Mucilaginibacter sp. HMF5004]|uniref:DUF4450 domain-containing protein n=1 Tax=Mucilaginibacter rivuli TaxID=2857527 RepID=UPI001C600B2D|nr:DUF4450 domain-containing protein [Mucilaginibacter rivuli]MBW4889548.1 DUF4450 domain-containing protein [Mucilaginibacter rivuli]